MSLLLLVLVFVLLGDDAVGRNRGDLSDGMVDLSGTFRPCEFCHGACSYSHVPGESVAAAGICHWHYTIQTDAGRTVCHATVARQQFHRR